MQVPPARQQVQDSDLEEQTASLAMELKHRCYRAGLQPPRPPTVAECQDRLAVALQIRLVLNPGRGGAHSSANPADL